MTEIEILYDKIYNHPKRNDDKFFIDFYEENKNLIESSDTSVSESEYDKVLKITSDYALSLYHHGYSKKAATYLDKAIHFFTDCERIDLTNGSLYEKLDHNLYFGNS